MTIDVSIIFPAFNEELRIFPTLSAFDAYLFQSGMSYEILVVDDGSTDGTCALVNEMVRSISSLKLIKSEVNKGKGYAVRMGMLQAKGRVRVFSDADGSTPPQELSKLLDPVFRNEVAIAIGSRYIDSAVIQKRQPIFRRLWSRSANLVIQNLLLPGILDTHCGFKAFNVESVEFAFSQGEIDGWSFDLEILALARLGGFSIREIPVIWKNDPRSKAKLSHLPKAIWEFLQIVKKIHSLKKLQNISQTKR